MLGVLGLALQQLLESPKHNHRYLGAVDRQGILFIFLPEVDHVAVHHLEQVVLQKNVMVCAAAPNGTLAQDLVGLVQDDDQTALLDAADVDPLEDVPYVQTATPALGSEAREIHHADQAGVFAGQAAPDLRLAAAAGPGKHGVGPAPGQVVVGDKRRSLHGLRLADDLPRDAVADVPRGICRIFFFHIGIRFLIEDVIKPSVKFVQHFLRQVALEILHGLQRLGGQRRYPVVGRIGQQAGHHFYEIPTQGVICLRCVADDVHQNAPGGPAAAVVEKLRQFLDFGHTGLELLVGQGIEFPAFDPLVEGNGRVLDVGIRTAADDLGDAAETKAARGFFSHKIFDPLSY